MLNVDYKNVPNNENISSFLTLQDMDFRTPAPRAYIGSAAKLCVGACVCYKNIKIKFIACL